jgi:AraC family transcriptional regulator
MTTALRIAQGSFGRVALLDMDSPLVAHAHSQCHIVLKAGGADSAFYVRNQRQPVTDRTAILVNAWEPHHYVHGPAAPRTLYLALYVEPRWLAAIHSPLQLSARPDFFPQPCVEISPRIRRLADELLGELVSALPIPQARLESLLFELMLAFTEPYAAWQRLGELGSGSSRVDGRIQRAIGYMREHLHQPLDVDQLARVAHLSRAQFFLRFRRCTRLTPNVFINMMRVETACQRLAQVDNRTPLGQVAQDLAFSDQGNFTRFIRSHVGVTPGEYRRVVEVFGGQP